MVGRLTYLVRGRAFVIIGFLPLFKKFKRFIANGAIFSAIYMRYLFCSKMGFDFSIACFKAIWFTAQPAIISVASITVTPFLKIKSSTRFLSMSEVITLDR